MVELEVGRSREETRVGGTEGKGMPERGGEDVKILSLGPSVNLVVVAVVGIGKELGGWVGLEGRIGRDWMTPYRL